MNNEYTNVFTAIASNSNLLVIKNNRVIGKASIVARYGSDVGVRFTEGEILDLVKDLELVKAVGLRYAYYHFSALSGGYIGSNDEDCLLDVMVVDEFNIRWGMVPEYFSVVPGYRAAEIDDPVDQ